MKARTQIQYFMKQKASIAVSAAVFVAFAMILIVPGATKVYADGTIGYLNDTPYTSFQALTNDLEENCKNKTVTIEMATNWSAGNDSQYDRKLIIPEGCKATLNMHGYVFNRNHSYDFHWYEDEGGGELIFVSDKASLTVNGYTTEAEKKREHKNVAVFISTAKRDNADGRKTFYGGLLTGGVSSNGSGGIHIKEGCTVTLNDVTIAGCNADNGVSIAVGIKSGYGGGVFVKGKGSKLTLNDSTITGCHAFRDGGGIYEGNYDNVDITLNNSHVDGNFATDDGGGINMDGENISLVGKNGSTVSRNECTDLGGGVYIWNDKAAVRGLTIEGNKALWGGGIYTTEEDITLSGLTIKNNTADFQGGGIFIENDGNEINSCTITGNTNYGVCMDSGCDKDMLVSGKTVIKGNQKGNLTLQDDSDIIDFAENEEMDVHIGYITNPTATEGYAISHMQLDYSNQLTADDNNYVVVYSYHQVNQDKTGRRLRYIKKSNQSDDYGRATQKPDFERVRIKDAGPAVQSNKVYAGGEKSGSGDRYALTRAYLHHPKNDGGRDTDSPFYYTDGFFYGDPYVYNDHLASASWNLAMSGFYLRRWDNDYTYKHQGARQFMADIGCPDQKIYVNDSLVSKPGIDTIGVAIGSKNLQKYNGSTLEDTGDILIAVAIRGAGYEAEWGSNVTLGSGNENRGADKKGEAFGFSQAADQTMEAIDYYINRYDLQDEVQTGKVKFWVSGFSRAGATANITSKRLVEKYADGSEGKNNLVFSYPLEAPKGGTDKAEQLTDKTKYYCIHNIVNSGDVVPLVAPGEMGFKRYGVDHYIPGTVINAKTRSEYNRLVKKTETTPIGSASASGIDKVTTYADNEYLDTKKDMKSKASDKYNQYVARRDDMVKHLATIDSTMRYNDYFHPYGTMADWSYYGKFGYYDGTKVEVFLPDFMAFLMQEATEAATDDTRENAKVRVNRGKYAEGSITVNDKSYPALQKVARDYFGAKKDYLTPITSKGGAIFNAMDWFFTTGISIRELYTNLLGEYYQKSPADKEKYIKYFWDLADGQGAFSGLSTTEYNTIKEDWFSIADTALHFVDGDYNLGEADEDSFAWTPGHPNNTDKWINRPTIELTTSRLVYALTLFENMDVIIGINHCPEVGMAWTRTYDDYYSKDNGEPKDFTEYKVNWVDTDNPDNVDGYSVDAPSAYVKDAKEPDTNNADGGDTGQAQNGQAQNDEGNTYTELIEHKNDGHKEKNNESGDTRVYLETGKIYDDTASTVSDDTTGEAIFYDLYDVTGGDHDGERIELAKKQIYRGGVDLAAGNEKKAYKIVTYALSYGVKSYDESIDNRAIYYINVRSGAHAFTRTIDPAREGVEPQTEYYDEAEKVALIASDYGDMYFDHWVIECKGPEDTEWTDVTKYLLPSIQPTRPSTWFKMPDTGSTTSISTTSAYTWPEHYELMCTAYYLPKIKTVTAINQPERPVAGENLDIGVTFYFDDNEESTHVYDVRWVYTKDGKEIVHRGKADYGTAYSAVFTIYPGEDSQGNKIVFASQEYLEAVYKPTTEGVTTSITKNANGSVTVRINFPKTASKPKHTVTFLDGWRDSDHNVLKRQEVESGGAATEPSDAEWEGHDRDGYDFIGWDKTFDYVTENITVTAIWEAIPDHEYTVTFADGWNESDDVIDEQTVEYGQAADAPDFDDDAWEGHRRPDHTFKGWDKTFDYITDNLLVTALWEENDPAPAPPEQFTVTFVDGWRDSDHNVLKRQEVESGGAATEPTDAQWEGHDRDEYTFIGWDKTFDYVTDNITVTAIWEAAPTRDYTVTFADGWNEADDVISEQTVAFGGAANAPDFDDDAWEGHRRPNYTFKGWDKNFNYITEDLEVTALWEEDDPLDLVIQPYDIFAETDIEDYDITYYVYPGETVTLTAPDIKNMVFAGWDYVEYDGNLVDPDDRLKQSVKVTIPENQKKSMFIRLEYGPVVSGVEVSLDVPKGGQPIQTKAAAGDNDNPATMILKIGNDSYEVHPDYVTIDWVPDPSVKGEKTIANYLTPYTAMVRLKTKEDEHGDDHIKIRKVGDTDYTTVTDLFLYSEDVAATVNGGNATLIKTINEVDYTFPATLYTLEKIYPPEDIAGVKWGATEDDVKAFLPSYVEILLDDGTVMNAEVTWADPSITDSSGEYGAKTWTAEGTVKLPDGVNNKEGEEAIDLHVSVNVFVDAAESVAAPEAEPAPGIYLQDQKVTLSTSTEGATIWYTTDGSDPSDSENPNRKEYIEGDEIPIDRADATEEETDAEGSPMGRKQIVLKAVAAKGGMVSSGVRTYAYIFANEIEVPEGKALTFDDEYQVGVKGGRFYKLEAISEGVVIDEEGNAIAKEPGTYRVRAVLDDKDSLYWIVDPEDPDKNTNEDQIIEFTIVDESAPDDPDKPDPDKPDPDKPDPDRPDPDKPDPDKPDPDKPTPAVKQFSLVFELNGGSLDGEEGTVTRTYDEGTVITLPAPTRKGYSFDYWKGSRYEAGQVYQVSEDHTFEAQWKKGAGSGDGTRTGDETRILSWMALLTISLLGLIFAVLFRRKEQ